MKTKPGVSYRGIRPEMAVALVAADAAYRGIGQECVVTSCTDGRHGRGSLHYKGLALDFRTRHMESGQADDVEADMRAGLGGEFDVVVEATHIHCEFDPKEPSV